VDEPSKGGAAFGQPGIGPRWTRSAKDAIGTAYSTSSRVWFTTSAGVLNEVYYPTIDRPQIRDLLLLVTDGKTFFHDERRHLDSATEYCEERTLAVGIVNADPGGRYRLVKEVISDPHEECVLMHVALDAAEEVARELRLFVLLAPHLDVGGADNNGHVTDVSGHTLLTANKDGTWLALGATVPFVRRSCGFVGRSDGWTDLADDFDMDWQFDSAEHGNIALTGELDLSESRQFTLALSFGDTFHQAISTNFQSLGLPFRDHRRRFVQQWHAACGRVRPLEGLSCDGGRLYHRSHGLLLAHEDKTYPGALIASLSIPWGETKGDEDLGGYHLVWTRDLYHSAMALVASGNLTTPLRALIYLAVTQNADGGFHQNFWVDGSPYWKGIQLDEVAFPILLAWRLHEEDALEDFDPYPMVLAAAGYLVRNGPITPQDRWEEASGYSPSTLASNVAALTCASLFARGRGDEETAGYLRAYADFVECHIEAWTVTGQGDLVPDVSRHYVRINPVDLSDPRADEDPDHGTVSIKNLPADEPSEFPAKEVVDGGFLDLVRYGVRKADSPLMEDSLRVVDATLRVETPGGPAWHRYNHDGYGQGDAGEAFEGTGRGRAWPLLTGERGHYELAGGRSPEPFIRAMEWFSNGAGLLPEQVWDEEVPHPEVGLSFGRPTGSAMPLMWAHAEYVRLLRSADDGAPFDRIEAVAERYLSGKRRRHLEIWKFNRQPGRIRAGSRLRIQAGAPFRLHCTLDEWATVIEIDARGTRLGVWYADVDVSRDQKAPVRFTFRWTDVGTWEGRDFAVLIDPAVEG
jgi:glucoamylase